MKQTIIIIVLVIVIAISLVVIKIPYTLECSGKILPSKEWIIKNADGGDLISLCNNQQTNTVYDYTEYKFERGDIAKINYVKEYLEKTSVKKGDTIGYIASYLYEEKLSHLRSELNEEQAYLYAINTGEKKSLVEKARNQMEIANQEFELQSKNYERQKALYEKQIIPAAEYEIALNAYLLAKTNIELAGNNQMTVETGEKPELVNYSNSKINSVIEGLKILDYKRLKYTLIAPFDGKIVTKKFALSDPSGSAYPILHVIDTSEYIVLMPVELHERKYVSINIKFTANFTADNKVIEGEYVGEDQDVELTGNYKQVFILKGRINSEGMNIPYGIYVGCSINCGKVSLLEYIKRKIRV